MRKLLPAIATLALLSACSGFPVQPVPEDPSAMERSEGQAAPDPDAVGQVLANMAHAEGGNGSPTDSRQAVASAETIASGRVRVRPAPSEPAVGANVLLPFGAVGKACDLDRGEMGALIEKSGRWKLYDARPGSTAVRNFFVTGFKDRCARQVTGAVALFGDLELYELVHFGGGGGTHGAQTDAAYRQIRGKACRGEGPCDARGVKRLNRTTAFVSVYPAAGANRSMELLMHDRELVAKAVK